MYELLEIKKIIPKSEAEYLFEYQNYNWNNVLDKRGNYGYVIINEKGAHWLSGNIFTSLFKEVKMNGPKTTI